MITTTDIGHLATLARIKLEDSEKQELTKDIDAILSYVDEIKKATIDMEYTPTPGAVHNIFRADEARVLPIEDREAILKEAPQREGDFFAVKKIISED
ncbi:MAG: Asp-tRNA(Asn)/Glu-tRNA(Gln) amidotransferase subunit GatC [Patescibacteria group bacterium]